MGPTAGLAPEPIPESMCSAAGHPLRRNARPACCARFADFIKEVIGSGEKVVLVGNSLGGYNSLAAAAKYPELVK